MDDKDLILSDFNEYEECESTLTDALLDETNVENLKLYNEEGKVIEFVQIATVPMRGALYVILKPVEPLEGMSEDEALVFSVEGDDGEEHLEVVFDQTVIDEVFAIYDALFDEAVKQGE